MKVEQKTALKGEKISAIIFLFIFICGVVYHLVPVLKPLVIKSTSFVLLLANVTVIYYLIRRDPGPKLKIWLLTAFLVSFFCEVTGVKTGIIFGYYSYSEVLRPSVFSVPLIIGVNWVVLTLAGYAIIAGLNVSKYFISLANASLITLFDYNMEPIAIKLNYWQWPDNVVPLKNYISWFVIVFLLTLTLQLFKIKPNSLLLKLFLVIQVLFFLSLNLLLK